MYVSVSRLQVPLEQCEAVITAFQDRAGLVDAFPGFLDLEVWRSDKVRSGSDDAAEPTQEVWMVSRWESREDFASYMRSPEHRVSHDRIDPGLHRAIRLERLEQLHGTYEVVAR